MPELAFHFNAPDKLVYACRLLRKAVAAGARVVVTAEAEVLERLDTLLWTFSQTDFIPHARLGAAAEVVAASPVVLAEAADAPGLPHHEVLVNLGPSWPEGFEQYRRVIEVVGQDETDRQQARARWKRYSALGHAIEKHDLNLHA
ncbi:MAG: DNA polymerase III subunit chi [Hylemonella sp.]